MKYHIDKDAAWGTTTTADNSRTHYEGEFKNFGTAVTGLTDELSHSPASLLYFSVFVTEKCDPLNTSIAGHTLSAINGARSALNAYVSGDEKMMLEAQRNSQKAVWPEDAPGSKTAGPTSKGR